MNKEETYEIIIETNKKDVFTELIGLTEKSVKGLISQMEDNKRNFLIFSFLDNGIINKGIIFSKDEIMRISYKKEKK
ncbi:unnamed protein product [marine sediment metagenome]|uniref:Uncharacterized protein n=1 Tax=marine sediment metagenome TaxID=412755 RepID=X0U4Q3_9ZZZZ